MNEASSLEIIMYRACVVVSRLPLALHDRLWSILKHQLPLHKACDNVVHGRRGVASALAIRSGALAQHAERTRQIHQLPFQLVVPNNQRAAVLEREWRERGARA